MFQILRRLGYAWMVLHGIIVTMAPKQVVALTTRLWLFGFDNVGELEAREWYLAWVRSMGIGMIAGGLAGMMLDKKSKQSDEQS